jgi:DNA-binding beta-propeller fold protein YncE
MRRRHALLCALPAVTLLSPLAGCGDREEHSTNDEAGTQRPPSSPKPDPEAVDDIMASLPQSCAFECSACDEPEAPFACPTLKPWDKLPHAAACAPWDGRYPAKVSGKCTASEPTGEAARKAGPIPGGLVLPDGHRIKPAGRDVLFEEADLAGGFPMGITPLGDHFALVSDGGIYDNALRLIDIDALAFGGAPVVSYAPFHRPTSLFYGMAFLPPDRVLASGGGDGIIYAFDVDTTNGSLKRAMERDLALGNVKDNTPYYASAIAATADGQRLLVAPSEHAEEILILSLAAADYGSKLAAIPIKGTRTVFDLRLDPFDPSGSLFYASDESRAQLLEISAETAKISRSIPLAKNPAQIVFLDATYLVVAESDSDKLAIVNRAAGMVEAEVEVFEKGAPHGFSPSALAYDPNKKRLYAALAGVNAIEAYDVAPGAPPTITPVGRIPTAWWPTGVMVHSDGSLVITNGKGHGTGTDGEPYPWGEGPITERMRGSVQHVPAALLADLGPLTATVEEGRSLGEIDGHPTITCPAGASDFPIPADNQSGPSAAIKHVILVVRENKTYDAVFGDRPDLGDGDPKLIMAGDPVLQEKIWANARAIAKAFTNFDNFYTDAEQSIQGHTWTVYGRSTDYMERAWLSIWGRGTRSVATPTLPLAAPEEGSVFAWLSEQGIGFDNMGEIIGNSAIDGNYPGLVYAQNRPDVDKSCYIGGRIRLLCDLKPFTYALQTNDHTYGGKAGAAAPEVMIAVNDEAAGMLLDALSHSPAWKDSLLIFTEDDPQDGGDHVDLHRSILLMASPWVRRGYVSHGHYDMASVYKLVAHIFGIPYHNEMIRSAGLPIDAFTSTPDYTPYSVIPRTVKAPCNAASRKEAEDAEAWDFEDIDDQPGLSQQIMKMMKDSAAERGVRAVR